MKEKFSGFFCLFLVFLFYLSTQFFSYYYSHMTLMLFMLSIVYLFLVAKQINKSLFALLSYVFAQGIYLSFYHPTNYFDKFGADVSHYIAKNSLQAVFMIVIMSFVFLIKKSLVKKLIVTLGLFNTVLILLRFYENYPDGIMNNASMDACLIAITYPVLYEYSKIKNAAYHWFVILAPAIAIILSKSSIGIFALIASILCLGLFQKKVFWSYIVCMIIVSICSCFYFGELIDDNHRFHIYKIVMSWWLDNANLFTGTGVGTGWVFIPWIQKIKSFTSIGYFTWLHSDWLQILFELGFIGLFLSILTVFSLLRSCWRKNDFHLFTAIVSYSCVMVFNMPTRWALTAFLGACLMRLCHGDDKRKEDDGLAKRKNS